MVILKIKVNACILTHPINNYRILEESFQISYFINIAIFSYTPINGDQQSHGSLKNVETIYSTLGLLVQ